MASGRWRPSPALNELVIAQYARFNVFQLMRLLLRRGPGRNWPTGQRLRFQAELGAPFQGTEITRLAAVPARKPVRDSAPAGTDPARIALHTPNYCIGSELGPLPAPFLEWIRDQQRSGAGAMAAFLNMFNQRIQVLRYELKQRSVRALDPALPADTRYAEQLAALMGLALPGQQAQIPLPKRAWLGMAGLLINNRRSADVVAQVMARYLGVPVRLQMLVGRWRDIEPGDRISLGRCTQRLGRSSLLGQRMWDSQAGVRLEIGRMTFERALALLPLRQSRALERLPQSRHAAFVSLIHLLLDRRHDCDVQVSIATDSIPPAWLTRAGEGVGLRLGQTAWLAPDRDEGMRARQDAALPVSLLRLRVAAYPEIAGHVEVSA